MFKFIFFFYGGGGFALGSAFFGIYLLRGIFVNLGEKFLKLSHIFLPLLIQPFGISFQDLSCLRGLKQRRIKELSGIP